ncbi:MAG: hypothetical protein HKO53_17855 [Gemmatimonadetes bacterium]|nr:hypothetical protein [Gemmatimonadota bacterium]
MAAGPRKRGFLILALLLFCLAAAVDLMRPGSLLRGTWARMAPTTTQMERTVDQVQRSRPAPRRINRNERNVDPLEAISAPRAA